MLERTLPLADRGRNGGLSRLLLRHFHAAIGNESHLRAHRRSGHGSRGVDALRLASGPSHQSGDHLAASPNRGRVVRYRGNGVVCIEDAVVGEELLEAISYLIDAEGKRDRRTGGVRTLIARRSPRGQNVAD